MTRRWSDRLKIVGGSAIAWLIVAHVIADLTKTPTSTASDLIFAAFGAATGVLSNMEGS